MIAPPQAPPRDRQQTHRRHEHEPIRGSHRYLVSSRRDRDARDVRRGPGSSQAAAVAAAGAIHGPVFNVQRSSRKQRHTLPVLLLAGLLIALLTAQPVVHVDDSPVESHRYDRRRARVDAGAAKSFCWVVRTRRGGGTFSIVLAAKVCCCRRQQRRPGDSRLWPGAGQSKVEEDSLLHRDTIMGVCGVVEAIEMGSQSTLTNTTTSSQIRVV